MKKVTTCRCCKSKNLFLYLDLGKQPLANSYHTKEKLLLYPLEVNVCQNCYHSQLSIVVNPELMFKDYLYVSGTTTTFRKHCEDLAKDAVKRINKKNITVLDIACNDGTQLEYFRDLGCDVYGVDPAENLRSITQEKSLSVVVDYWNLQSAKKLKLKFDLITGTNVFAHVDRIDKFLKTVTFALKKEGILILEFPYCDKMVEFNEFDTVYHEHLSYFLVNSFSTLASRMNFQIVDLLQTHIHGGSIRFFLKKGVKKHCKKVFDLIEQEKKHGLFDLQTYKRFAQQVDQNKQDMRALIKNLKKSNEKLIGYGASAKGNTMLNYFKIDLEYIVDDNSLKWDRFTPGRNIPIKSPQILKKEKRKLNIVILSWNFYKGINKALKKLRNKKLKDRCIFYIPTVTSVSLYDTNHLLPTA